MAQTWQQTQEQQAQYAQAQAQWHTKQAQAHAQALAQQAQANAQALTQQPPGFAGVQGMLGLGNVQTIPNQFVGPHPGAPVKPIFAPTAPTAPAPATAPATAQPNNINISDQLYHILTIFYKSLELNDADLLMIESINELFGTKELSKYYIEQWLVNTAEDSIGSSRKNIQHIKTTCLLDLIYIVPSLFIEKGFVDENGRMISITNVEFFKHFSLGNNLTERELYFLQILENFLELIMEIPNRDNSIIILSKLLETYNNTLILETKLNNDIRIDTNELENNLHEFNYEKFTVNFNKLTTSHASTPGMPPPHADSYISVEDWKIIHESYIEGSGYSYVTDEGDRFQIHKGMLVMEGVTAGISGMGLVESVDVSTQSRILCGDTPNQNHLRGWNYLFGKIKDQEITMPRNNKFENYPIWDGITPQDTSCFFNDNYDNMMRLCINRIKKFIELQSVELKYLVMMDFIFII